MVVMHFNVFAFLLVQIHLTYLQLRGICLRQHGQCGGHLSGSLIGKPCIGWMHALGRHLTGFEAVSYEALCV